MIIQATILLVLRALGIYLGVRYLFRFFGLIQEPCKVYRKRHTNEFIFPEHYK